MEGDLRREKIIKELSNCSVPVSGTELAKKFGVSRQVIVQDIALLRAYDKNILSTNKGYLMFAPQVKKYTQSFCIHHEDAQIQDELMTIVKHKGKILDVVIEHEVYGQIMVDLIIVTEEDVNDFLDKILKSKSKPLSLLTNGEHYHTVEAESELQLYKIEKALEDKGYLRKK